ncbi:hypothetical protein AOQ88_00215 [Candidatus Riesia sp. GBBU]|nr:hypothetical protein AOQ88_00215 [Candidatus Riesia sp. GBBU]
MFKLFDKKNIILRKFGIEDYLNTVNKMNFFTKNRKKNTLDEVWLLEHNSVFTVGRSTKKISIPKNSKISIIETDRGGSITYHGSGQQILYVLLDLKRNSLKIRNLIYLLEDTVISTLKDLNINSQTNQRSPGIYVDGKKICSFGLKIHNGCSMHGLALNVSMDMSPFNEIVPCGNFDINMTQIREFIPDIRMSIVEKILVKNFCRIFNFQKIN